MPSNAQIRSALKGKIDPELGRVLISLNEDNAALKQMVNEIAGMINQLADLMGKQQLMMDTFKPYINKMKQLGLDVGSDPTVTGEHDT